MTRQRSFQDFWRIVSQLLIAVIVVMAVWSNQATDGTPTDKSPALVATDSIDY